MEPDRLTSCVKQTPDTNSCHGVWASPMVSGYSIRCASVYFCFRLQSTSRLPWPAIDITRNMDSVLN